MDNAFLNSLYDEHRRLTDLLNSISSLILKSGGKLPQYQNEDSALLTIKLNANAISPGYPVYGTWKEKILYALEKINSPTPVTGIVHFISREEPTVALSKIHDMVTQYCSSMAVSDIIGVDKTDGRRNIYFLKSNNH